MLAAAAESGVHTVAVGGDGMVHLAVNEFAYSGTTLGIIPSGTGNDFASAIGLPSDVDAAADAAAGPTTDLDLLRIDPPGRYAASVATFGFSAVVNERAETMRWPKGSSKYTVATVLESLRLRAAAVELVLDGVVQHHDLTLAAVANTSRFGGGMQIAPAAVADDGELDLIIVGDVGRFTLLRVLPRAFSGRHVDHSAVSVHRARSVEVRSAAELSIRADGEHVVSTPATIEVATKALRLAGLAVA